MLLCAGGMDGPGSPGGKPPGNAEWGLWGRQAVGWGLLECPFTRPWPCVRSRGGAGPAPGRLRLLTSRASSLHRHPDAPTSLPPASRACGQPKSQHALRPAPWHSVGLPEATACPDSHSQIESKTN